MHPVVRISLKLNQTTQKKNILDRTDPDQSLERSTVPLGLREDARNVCCRAKLVPAVCRIRFYGELLNEILYI